MHERRKTMTSVTVVTRASNESGSPVASWQERRSRRASVFGEGAEMHMRLFIFTGAEVPRASRERDRRRGDGSVPKEGNRRGYQWCTHMSNSTVGASVSSKSVIVPASSLHHLTRILENARRAVQRRRPSPLLFKTMLRRVTAPFVAAFSALPT